MATQKESISNDATKMIRAFCILVFTVLLHDYCTGNVHSGWTIIMAAVVLAFLVINTILVLQQKVSARIP
jgi:hypothetical protein